MHPWFALPCEVKNDFCYFKAYKFFEGFPQTATNLIKSTQIDYLGTVTNVNTPYKSPIWSKDDKKKKKQEGGKGHNKCILSLSCFLPHVV
jgi:hypothetical protein